MLALRNLSLGGAPLTRVDRLARQAMDSSLMLSPQLYNNLVFGETDTYASAPARADRPPPRRRLEEVRNGR